MTFCGEEPQTLHLLNLEQPVIHGVLYLESLSFLWHSRTYSLVVLHSWSSTVISQVLFSRRTNYDSTEESICMHCLLTVARGYGETLDEAERNHDCEQAIIDECRRFEASQRGTF